MYMTKGITNKEPDPEIVYADIFHHPHWQSPTRPHMSLYDRAAQFAPFAALTGYEDMVSEEARRVEKEAGFSEKNPTSVTFDPGSVQDPLWTVPAMNNQR
jgi:hypothetical protein